MISRLSNKIWLVRVTCLSIIVDGKPRLQQLYEEKVFQEDYCVHGLAYRKHCDECEEYFEIRSDKMRG